MINLKIVIDGGYLEFEKKSLIRALMAAGREVAARTRSLIDHEGSGRLYFKPGGGSYHASAPGEAPALRSGFLEGSIVVRPFRSKMGVAIRSRAAYATALEAGARGGGNLAAGIPRGRHRRRGPLTARVLLPRPFLSRALGEIELSAQAAIERAVMQDITWHPRRLTL